MMMSGKYTVILAIIAVAVWGVTPSDASRTNTADTDATAPPYYRFWRGQRLSNLTTEEFDKEINDNFIESTVNVGCCGRGLVAYQVVLPIRPQWGEWDEIALVIYDSQKAYKELFSTPAGKAYQKSHSYIFALPPSNSKVPAPLPAGNASRVRFGSAYDVAQGTTRDWNPYRSYYTMSTRNPNVTDSYYISIITKYIQTGMDSLSQDAKPLLWLLLLESDYFMEFFLFKDGLSYQAAEPILREAVENVVIHNSRDLVTLTNKQGPLVPGTGLNVAMKRTNGGGPDDGGTFDFTLIKALYTVGAGGLVLGLIVGAVLVCCCCRRRDGHDDHHHVQHGHDYQSVAP